MSKDGLLTVCAWCYPSSTVYSHFPQYAGLPLSHGICATHRLELISGTPDTMSKSKMSESTPATPVSIKLPQAKKGKGKPATPATPATPSATPSATPATGKPLPEHVQRMHAQAKAAGIDLSVGTAKGKLGTLHGFSVISVMRALGASGWPYKRILAAMTLQHSLGHIAEVPAERTIRGAIRRGRRGEKTIANVTPEQIAALESTTTSKAA